ncbi:lamin tail domain-containing protein [bacterium]|nr:lamin tail domain-containing protein [bacterium]
MFDTQGSESHDEFVEIFNLSETESVSLTGWRLSDGSGVDGIVAHEDGLILAPRQFAVILDPSYFDNSGNYDHLILESSLILTIDNLTFGSRGFSNSAAETISLIDENGVIVSQYTYTLGNEMGFSDEKMDLQGANTPLNWSDSMVLLGTPGAPNSVSPLVHDLAILPTDLKIVPQMVKAGDAVTVSASLRNVGLETVGDFELIIFEDMNEDSLVNAGEALSQPFGYVDRLEPGDSTVFTLIYENVRSGRHLIGAKIEFTLDENLENNFAAKEVLVGFGPGSIIVNEIMYSPTDGQAEWIELFNRSTTSVDLAQWMLSDVNTSNRAFLPGRFFLGAGEFFVMAQDSSLLPLFDLSTNSFSIMQNWPALNNDFDSVILYDLTDLIVDRVDYSQNWGGERGISLERINPDLASNDSSNWSSSVAFEGGTPGQPNSIFTEVLPSSAALTIKPNPFSPDGDGQDDFTAISYQIPLTTAVVNLKIYDMRGRLIRFLANVQPTGSQSTVIWDGKNDEDRPARMGIYIVFLQALNAQAGVLKTAKKTVVLAGKL